MRFLEEEFNVEVFDVAGDKGFLEERLKVLFSEMGSKKGVNTAV